jgi:hypothetical protein
MGSASTVTIKAEIADIPYLWEDNQVCSFGVVQQFFGPIYPLGFGFISDAHLDGSDLHSFPYPIK